MPTIGEKIKKKIVEILQTGSLQKADNLGSLEKNHVLTLFSNIWGVGASTAAMFYFKGWRTLEDLQKNEHLLSKNQKIGLKYFDDFKHRIPRAECDEIVSLVTNQIQLCSDGKAVYDVIACGSYRRGAKDCGDIDILVTRRDGKFPHGFLLYVVTE